jgi:CTP synthase (UTP-ammonia lyase)
MGRENFCSIHVSLVPQPSATGEHKTKPTQVPASAPCVNRRWSFTDKI